METKKEFVLRHIKAVQKMKPNKKLDDAEKTRIVKAYAKSKRDVNKYKKLLSSKKSRESFINIDYEAAAIESLKNRMETKKVKHTKESKIICDYIDGETKRLGMVCNNCSTLFKAFGSYRSKAKHPVYCENKKFKYYLCSKCKFKK